MINKDFSVEKIALVQNAKRPEFPERDCKVAWDRLINKCAPHTALSLLTLKNEIHNSKMNSAEKDLD